MLSNVKLFLLSLVILFSCSNLPKNTRIQADIVSNVIPQFSNAVDYKFIGFISTDSDTVATYHIEIFFEDKTSMIYPMKYRWISKFNSWGLINCDYKRTHRIQFIHSENFNYAKVVASSFDWNCKGPVDFIHYLEDLNKHGFPCYTIWTKHYGWIEENDLFPLIKLLYSRNPCASVKSPISSTIQISSVGDEAVHLLNGYIHGVYPIFDKHNFTYQCKEDIMIWWDKYNTQKLKQN